MRTFEKIIERIQVVLNSENDPETVEMNDLVLDYNSAVNEANDRLRQCEELLSRGLRSEAIQLCESNPNLLDLTSILDFPEVDVWAYYVSQFQLPPIPELLIGVASELDEAYAEEQPLKALLRQHRLHALALSPLATRISVLREVIDIDVDNPAWAEDLQNYEKTRHSQIQSELAIAFKARNTSVVATLETELIDPDWRTRPERKLLVQAKKSHNRLRSYDAQCELQDLAEQLNAAFADFDLQAGRLLESRWSALIEIVSPSDSTVELATPALEWLEEQNQKEVEENEYLSNVARIEKALDHDASREQLDRVFHAATRHGREISQTLNRRLSDRFRFLEEKATRKSRLIVLAVVASIVFVGALTAFVIRQNMHSNDVFANAQSLDRLITDGNLDEAKKFINKLDQESPSVAQSPEIQKLAADLAAAKKGEGGRRKRFDALLRTAETMGLNSPDWDSFDKAFAQLKVAESVALNSAELSEVELLRREISAQHRKLQSIVDKQFLSDLAETIARLKKLPQDDVDAIDRLMSEFKALKARPNVNDFHKNPIDDFLASLTENRAVIMRRITVGSDLRKITDAIGDPDLFQHRLNEYVRSNPGTSRSVIFSQVATKEHHLWSGPEAWALFRGKWLNYSLTQTSPNEARILINEYKDFMNNNYDFPGDTRLYDRLKALEAVSLRMPKSGKAIQNNLTPILRSHLKRPLMVLENQKRTNMVPRKFRYYTDEDDLEVRGRIVRIRPFIDTLGEREKTVLISFSNVGNQLDGKTFDWRAPQAIVARNALSQISMRALLEWEETFSKLINEIYDSDLMDPIVRVSLMFEFIRLASKGSIFMEVAFKNHLDALGSFSGSSVDWITPLSDARTMRATRVVSNAIPRPPVTSFNAPIICSVLSEDSITPPNLPIA